MKSTITNKITTPVLTIFALILFGATIGTAAPGDLDLDFGSRGIVVTSFAGQYYYDEARTVRVQPDGKMVVCGQSFDWDGNEVSSFLARYDKTGVLDPSFGTNGKIIIPFFFGGSFVNDIALQPDGKVITVGRVVGTYNGFRVHRYNANGTFDTSFGVGGEVITPVGEYAEAYSVAIRADGRIVVAGIGSGQGYSDFAVVRLLQDGSLDTSFNGTGKVITSFGNGSSASKVILQPDGKIVAAGTAYVSNNNPIFALARYNADGSLDSGFGAGGKVTHAISNDTGFGDAVLQPDGKIVASGNSIVFRCNPNGSLDTSFAVNGVFTEATNRPVADGIELQPDGKLVAFGSQGDLTNISLAILRLNPNGAPDTGFGTNGRVITPVGNYSHAADGAVQPDGNIVAFGSTSQPNSLNPIAIARYLGDSAVPRPAQFDFDGDSRADVSVFRPSDSVWYLNQSTNGFFATQFGLSTDKITPADYDGDGKTDISVFRDGTWYWLNSSDNSFNARPFGIASDIPVPSDFTGDGRAELAVYRNGTWWIQDLTNNQTQVVNFGLLTDKPVVADYDSDGRADQSVYRGSGEWHLNRSSQGYTVIQFGLATDKPVPADYDGDGKTDVAVYRDGTWYLLQSTNGFTAFQFGIATDIPVPADYDGDGKADAAIYRNGTWWLLQTTNGISAQQFGLANDKPVPSVYLP